jgi:hypothetical protein
MTTGRINQIATRLPNKLCRPTERESWEAYIISTGFPSIRWHSFEAAKKAPRFIEHRHRRSPRPLLARRVADPLHRFALPCTSVSEEGIREIGLATLLYLADSSVQSTAHSPTFSSIVQAPHWRTTMSGRTTNQPVGKLRPVALPRAPSFFSPIVRYKQPRGFETSNMST